MRCRPFVLTALAVAALSGGACRNRELDERIAALESETNARQARLTALETEMAAAKTEQDRVRTDLQAARDEAEKAHAAAEEVRKDLKAKTDELENVALHRDELREWIEKDLLPIAEKSAPELANLRDATEEMMKEVARIRGLEWKHPVMRRRLTRAEVGDWMRRDMRREMPEEKARDLVIVGAEMGLVPPETDFYEIVGDMMEGGAAAFYKPQTRTFYHIEGNDGRGAYPIVFHELVHALEDQHYDLEKVYRDIGEDTDRGLARRGLVEGSAALFQALYEKDHPKDKVEMVKAAMKGDTLRKQAEMLTKVPAFLIASIGLYPYQNGMWWVEKVTGRDPAKVAALYTDMPVSTEQVLHPEKWMDAAARDYPHVVAAPSLDALPESWKRVPPDTMGELTTGCLLAQLRSPGPQAILSLIDMTTQGLRFYAPTKEAVEGWDGDCVVAAVDPETEMATVLWVTVWDTPEDAEQFVACYAPLVGKKVTGHKVETLPSPIRFAEGDDDTDRVSGIVREGTRVVAVLGAPPLHYDALMASGLATAVTPDARDPADAAPAR